MTNLDYLYKPNAAKKVVGKHYFLDKKLGFQIIENGMILPHKKVSGTWFGLGGIVDNNNKYIPSSSSWYMWDKSYLPPPESIEHSTETVIYLNYFFYVWGHCITDNIRRVWFLKSDAFKNEFKDCPIVYIAWNGITIKNSPDFKRLLEILEVDVDSLQEITKPTQFKRIILPDESFDSPFYKIPGFTNEYHEHIDRIRNFGLKHGMPPSCKKIYFFHGKKGQFGEERLAEYFKSKGYEIINPEKPRLTFDEELNLLVNCESFASNGGSGAMNVIFLRDGTETIIIPRIASLAEKPYDSYQQIVNQVHPLKITYIDATLSIFGTNSAAGRWLYIISEQLKRFFGDKWDGYEEEDLKNFLQYVKNYIGKNLPLNPEAGECYAPVLANFMVQLKQHEDLIASCDIPAGWKNENELLAYQTYVHVKGWGDGWKNENEVSNPLGQMLEVLAVKINFLNHKVYYSIYYGEAEGRSEEVTAPEQAGTTGQRKSIMGIKIRLDEAGQKEFDILYRVHKFDGDWTDWAKNGEVIYSHGQKLNAIQIKLETKRT